MTELANNARLGHERGWAFTPLAGKIPQLKGWQQKERPSWQRVEQWVKDGYNLGLRTGQVSGVAVIDIDAGAPVGPDDFPLTASVLTASHGWHLYYMTNEPVQNRVGTLVWPTTGEPIPHVDLRGDGGQVVFPGSVVDGKRYIWQCRPDDVVVAPFPKQYLPPDRPKRSINTDPPAPAHPSGADRYYEAVLANEVRKVRDAREGTRHHTLNRVAYHLGGFVGNGSLDRGQVEQRLLLAITDNGLLAEDGGNARRTIQDGINNGIKAPYPLGPVHERSEAMEPPHDAWCECPSCTQAVADIPQCEF